MKRLAVYCGSSMGNDPAFADAARSLGAEMAARSIGLVYGGGRLGGIGTYDELFEAWTWNALGYHAKPFALLNVAGFWDEMIRFLDHATASGFMSPARRAQLMVADSIDQAIMMLDAAVTASEKKMVW
jgi:predicted Rossmann-fold nucleotide-binding protein